MSMTLAARLGAFSRALETSVWTNSSGATVAAEDAATQAVEWVLATRQARARLYIIGNGGSAAIAGHSVNDFVNMVGISAFTLHDSPILTCMTNDFGYEQAYARMLQTHAGAGDLLFAISSSGKSPNICNAVRAFRQAGGQSVLTLTGFGQDNPLRTLGDLNLWIDARDYGIVEIGHQFILHNLSDRIANQHS